MKILAFIFTLIIALSALGGTAVAQFNSGAVAATTAAPPPLTPRPTGISPSSQTVADTTASGTTIAVIPVTMTGGTFNGSCSVGGSNLVSISASSGGCTLAAATTFSSSNDGIYSLTVNPCQNGSCLNPSSSNFTLTIANNGSGVPAPAAAAGFTTEALNADFTSSAYANKATFINECGATAQFRFYWVYEYSSTSLSCNDINVVSDPSFGVAQALHIAFQPSEWSSSTPGGTLLWPGYGYQTSKPCYTPCLPFEFYAEAVLRTSTNSWNQGTSGAVSHLAIFEDGDNIQPNGTILPDAIEGDFMEADEGVPPNGNASFGGGISGTINGTYCTGADFPCASLVTWWDLDLTAAYHKVGFLMTSDGSSVVWKCTYVDGVLVTAVNGPFSTGGSCVSDTNFPAGAAYQTHDVPLLLMFETFSRSVAPIYPIEAWYQSIRIWTCATWQTTMCPGPLVTH